MLQRSRRGTDGGRGATVAGVVHVLVSEHAFDADGSDVLHLVLFAGAGPGIHSGGFAEPAIAEDSVVPGI